MKLGNIILTVGALFALFTLTYGSGELADKFCYKTIGRLDNNCDNALQDCEQEFVQRFGKDSQPYGCKCRTDRTNLYHKCSCNVMC
ncbi:SCR-like protein [Medicago truncatula]|uniref:SCR-like protein n=1 Tax=Medicago truncatula TaxID=3880 RepID=A0A072UUM9_MEDTR|nr:SCR-like protein [Medicago truncatula]